MHNWLESKPWIVDCGITTCIWFYFVLGFRSESSLAAKCRRRTTGICTFWLLCLLKYNDTLCAHSLKIKSKCQTLKRVLSAPHEDFVVPSSDTEKLNNALIHCLYYIKLKTEYRARPSGVKKKDGLLMSPEKASGQLTLVNS